MKKTFRRPVSLALALALAASTLAGCGESQTAGADLPEGAVSLVLSDDGITVDGAVVTEDESAAVYTAHDIVYYEDGQDFTYGAGSESDAHTAEEAAAHTVVHITQPGTYVLSGTLSAGQIAVDLGEDAKTDPSAVVTLYLNGVDITCTVAPAVIFYRVYECDTAWVDYDENGTEDYEATYAVDTSAAGANVIIADGTENTISGSYVAKIYKPESVTLSEDGTEVTDAKKLHKYDGAFYSKMSMNVSGGEVGDGILTIQAENEGLDSELHLTINGGDIRITSGDDGINTNEDGVSVTTINGGTLTVNVTGGMAGEGDGIDSNGWLVINGGTVIAAACATSADSGLDSDMGIYLNGGTVIASGSMLDEIAEDSAQTYAAFSFAQTQAGGETYSLKNESGETVLSCTPPRTLPRGPTPSGRGRPSLPARKAAAWAWAAAWAVCSRPRTGNCRTAVPRPPMARPRRSARTAAMPRLTGKPRRKCRMASSPAETDRSRPQSRTVRRTGCPRPRTAAKLRQTASSSRRCRAVIPVVPAPRPARNLSFPPAPTASPRWDLRRRTPGRNDKTPKGGRLVRPWGSFYVSSLRWAWAKSRKRRAAGEGVSGVTRQMETSSSGSVGRMRMPFFSVPACRSLMKRAIRSPVLCSL